MKAGNKVYDAMVIVLTVPIIFVVGIMCVGLAVLELIGSARHTITNWFAGVDSHLEDS